MYPGRTTLLCVPWVYPALLHPPGYTPCLPSPHRHQQSPDVTARLPMEYPGFPWNTQTSHGTPRLPMEYPGFPG